jgi:hypothetical protein
MKTRLLYLLACLVLVGCNANESDENKPEEPAESFCYPLSYTEETRPVGREPYSLEREFVYDGLKQLVGLKYYANNQVVLEDTYEYDQSGQLVRENWYSGSNRELTGYYEQEYNPAGQLLSFTYYNFDHSKQKGVLDRKSDFAYNAKGELLTLLHYRPVDGVLLLNSYNEYTSANGLITEIKSYDSDQQLTKEVRLTYDNKKTYLRGLPRYRAQYISDGYPHEHNVMSKTVKTPGGDIIAAESYTRAATYNAQDYIKTTVTSYGDGRVLERSYNYECPKE